MHSVIAVALAFSSLGALAQELPDGGRIAVDGTTVARHAQDGTVIWRVDFSETPKVEVDGAAVRVESPSAILADSVTTAAEAGNGFKAMLRIVWKSARADRAVTTSKNGPWTYASIGNDVLLRLQHEAFGTIEPRTVQKEGALYVSAGSAGVFDDGTFTIAEQTPDWFVTRYKEMSAQRAATGKSTPAKELVASRWLHTDAPMPLSGLRGRVVLLDFWGNWCKPCVVAIPEVTRFAKAKSELVVIGVHSSMAADRLDNFLKRTKYDLPIAVDTGATMNAYGVQQWPTYILIDRKGNIRYRDVRMPPQKLVDQLLAEKP